MCVCVCACVTIIKLLTFSKRVCQTLDELSFPTYFHSSLMLLRKCITLRRCSGRTESLFK